MVQAVHEIFFYAEEVCEIRAVGLSGTSKSWEGFARKNDVVSGYFDNAQDFAVAATALDKARAKGVYFTINPCKPALLARAANRLIASPKATTTDQDVKCLRWLPIDLDPVRPSEISSTDKELKSAYNLAKTIAEYLEGDDHKFAKGIRACSGNGYHLVYRLPDLPNDEEHRTLIKRAIKAIESIFHNDQVDIDLKVVNPARIWKVYGTTGRKGDSTKDRPHRESYLLPDQASSLDEYPPLSLEQLNKLGALVPAEERPAYPPAPLGGKKKTARKTTYMKSDLGTLDVGAYLAHYGKPYKVKTKDALTLYCLDECLFDPNHKRNEASICFSPSPPFLTYQCFHNSCRERTWKEARATISGSDSLAPFCAGYDPERKSKKQETESKEFAGSFLTVNEKGRVVYNPALMANFLEENFAPLINEGIDLGAIFYRYDQSGVWKILPSAEIELLTRNVLEDFAQPKRIADAKKLVQQQTYKTPEDLQFDPMWVNLRNGMLYLPTFELSPHAPHYNSRVQLPVKYDKEAECLLWLKTLEEIFADDHEKIDVLQQFFGYCLYPKIRFPAALFQIGDGSNGKGTVNQILIWMLGEENVCHISLRRMEEKFGVVELKDKLLNSSGETAAKALEVTTFKEIAVGERIQVDQKYLPDIKFYPIAKHIISMNAFPGIKDKTHAFFRRIIVMEYKQRFENETDDKGLKEKLKEELSGIFMWSLEGLLKVLEKDEISIPESMVQAKKRFRARVNPVFLFVDEMCTLTEEAMVLPGELYKEYNIWCEEAKHPGLGKTYFYEQILTNFKVVKKRSGTKDFFMGIGLLLGEN